METSEVFGQFIETILPALSALFVALIAWAALRIKNATEKNVDNDTVRGMLQRLNDTVRDVVIELEQTEAEALRKAVAEDSPGGRKITAEEARDLRDKALDRIKRYYGVEGLKVLLDILGISSGSSETWLRAKVERAVYELKTLKGG